KNMRGYTNKRVEDARFSAQEWFYNWCVRLVLERISEFVEGRSLKEFRATKHVRLVFSERGGLRYSQTKAYLDLIRSQARSGQTFLATREIRWRVIHPNLVEYVPHRQSAGAQLADIVASAFYQACSTEGPGKWEPQYAKLLKPRMW